MEIFLHSETWIALLTLTFLEVVLGIDNIIFISIVTGKLPHNRQRTTRNLGLALAMIFRVALLLLITHIIGMKKPLFTLDFVDIDFAVSIRDLILAAGGIFLIAKSTSEIHQKIEGIEHHQKEKRTNSVVSAVLQIIMLDIIFSFDSILTAIGLTKHVLLMIIAVVIAMFIMMLFSGGISRFINKHPTLQILALSFLILIGFMLIVDALHYDVPKGYIYFAVLFSLLVEMLNMRMLKKTRKKQEG
ncbi:MAG TPA: TerC family protein [Bacteroidales bacterium]|nr:TerC family protein [Bacteroidales bacterium]